MRFKIYSLSSLKKTEHVIFDTKQNAGIIKFNRPKSLNALTKTMFSNIFIKLWDWRKEKKLVIIKGDGKSFSTGGDVKELVKPDVDTPMGVIAYNINHLIASYKIPYIALMDGYAMGSGLGLSVHGAYRIATENTVIAMPETKIGMMPDAGATYFLSKLPSYLGFYLGLTGNVLTGRDVTAVGLATHYVPSCKLTELEGALAHCTNHEDVKTTLNKFQEPVKTDVKLSTALKDIEQCFSANTVEDIIKRLELLKTEWADDTLKTLQHACPLALKLTLEAFHRGTTLILWQCLQMEYRVCTRLKYGHNFKEGVRAAVLDKDNNPKWIPKNIQDIHENDIAPYFAIQLDDELPVLIPKP